MPSTSTLKDVYADEIKDLWSANHQMTKVLKVMTEKAHHRDLKRALETAVAGIHAHTAVLKTLLADADEEVQREHCKGMEGLVNEAHKHISDEAPEDQDLLDIVIIAQYQRMSHYGLAGFGTAAAYAKALGMDEHVAKLKHIVSDIYRADEFASQLAGRVEHAVARAA